MSKAARYRYLHAEHKVTRMLEIWRLDTKEYSIDILYPPGSWIAHTELREHKALELKRESWSPEDIADLLVEMEIAFWDHYNSYELSKEEALVYLL